MITARGANAARRDGGDAGRRPTGRPRRPRSGVVSGASSAVAVSASVALAAAACASGPKPDFAPRLLPGNQDTAAAARNLPAPPARAALRPADAPPPTTITVSPGTYSSDKAAWQAMAATLTGTPPTAELTPQNSSGSPTPPSAKPPLEVITMPMWLWIDSPGSMVSEVRNDAATGDTFVTDTVVVDEVQWFLDGSKTPWVTCGSTTQPIAPTPTTPNSANLGPGIPYDPGMDPANAGDPQQLACVHAGFATPYYQATTVSGAPQTVDGVHTLQATVYWHVDYLLTDPFGYTDAGGNGNAQAMVPVQSANTLSFRVGEIQALVTQP